MDLLKDYKDVEEELKYVEGMRGFRGRCLYDIKIREHG